MAGTVEETLSKRLDESNYKKLKALKNPKLEDWLAKYIEHCNPDSVFICSGSEVDREYVREMAVKRGEERQLATRGHTIHYDGVQDQGRDKEVTKYLVPRGVEMKGLNTIEKKQGLEEVHGFMKDAMKGREMIVAFATLGPKDSKFAIPGVEITDSWYVVDSVKYLYREGYEEFKRLEGRGDFFKVVHCTGEVNERGCSRNPDKKRIYMDLDDNTVYSVNTQYAGNTVAFKKLFLRLAINKASKEGWLAEHMLVMGVKGPNDRKTYFLGAFPSFCGKTSTAMIPGESIVGDDLAYLRVVDGKVRAVNVERGIFGVIKDVNPKDDPLIWKLLTKEGSVIFSNVAVDGQNMPRWLGDKRPLPAKALNHLGEWTPEKTDAEGKKMPLCHQNARYTVELHRLGNVDSKLEDAEGVEPKAILYGGRDEDTTVPVEQAFDWNAGVVKGAILESQTTAAIVGQSGVRVMDPYSNRDFISIPIGRYVGNHLKFGALVKQPPQIFSVNYFLKNRSGEDLTDKTDKKVWLKWAELRVHGEVKALETPTGFIPRYEDLKRLFKEHLNKDFSKEKYDELFTVRIPEWLAKIGRGMKFYSELPETPREVFRTLEAQKLRLETLQKAKGDYVTPDELKEAD